MGGNRERSGAKRAARENTASDVIHWFSLDVGLIDYQKLPCIRRALSASHGSIRESVRRPRGGSASCLAPASSLSGQPNPCGAVRWILPVYHPRLRWPFIPQVAAGIKVHRCSRLMHRVLSPPNCYFGYDGERMEPSSWQHPLLVSFIIAACFEHRCHYRSGVGTDSNRS